MKLEPTRLLGVSSRCSALLSCNTCPGEARPASHRDLRMTKAPRATPAAVFHRTASTSSGSSSGAARRLALPRSPDAICRDPALPSKSPAPPAHHPGCRGGWTLREGRPAVTHVACEEESRRLQPASRRRADALVERPHHLLVAHVLERDAARPLGVARTHRGEEALPATGGGYAPDAGDGEPDVERARGDGLSRGHAVSNAARSSRRATGSSCVSRQASSSTSADSGLCCAGASTTKSGQIWPNLAELQRSGRSPRYSPFR